MRKSGPQKQTADPDTPAALETALPVLELAGTWEPLWTRGHWRRLQADVLPAYLARQRWFYGQAHTMARLRLVDYVLLHTAAPLVALTLVEVVYNDGGTETYTLFHGISADAIAEALLQTELASVLAHVRSPQDDGLLREALSTSVAGALLLSLLQEQRHIATSMGELGAFATEASQEARGYAAPLAGGRVHHRPVAEPTPLAILQGYVRSAGSGWDYTVGSLSPSTRRCVRC